MASSYSIIIIAIVAIVSIFVIAISGSYTASDHLKFESNNNMVGNAIAIERITNTEPMPTSSEDRKSDEETKALIKSHYERYFGPSENVEEFQKLLQGAR